MILYGTYVYDERVHRGILRFARTRGWRVKLLLPHAWQHMHGVPADGIVSLLEPEEDSSGMTDYLLSLGLPMVDLSKNRGEVKMPRLLPDLEQAGRVAAERFAQLGLKHVRYLCWGNNWHDSLRLKGFTMVARKHHMKGEILELHTHREKPQEAIQRFLGDAPKPVGVFCSFDHYASRVLDLCLEMGWEVPAEVAILGCYNHELDSALAEIPISSIDLDLEARGYRAAALLADLLEGKRVPHGITYCPIRGIIERATTEKGANRDPFVAAAVQFIESHLHQSLTVPDVATAVGLSRPALQRRFEKALGRGVATEIERLRIDKAKRLLLDMSESATAIGEELGFPDVAQFYRVFKRATGSTIGAFRKAHQQG